MDVVDYRYSFTLFLETRKENETFKKYNDGGRCGLLPLQCL